ncbi:ribose 5-phosphate isomerase B [Gottschalkia acidurici 9a]|uniref:Ribose 5-phosphate isomerase B n=1 Tax=Gottschalkia acidurici (strain ATCC 7906 / DSM 604 / BCRC 14475 / CIP 104303 / KCTC 5404 / NCIMB 10678 / 9a) TaxID=1128398 RepID=K0AWW6_GOTA9|nr:ribose 5-phosphate isomerase B [Gottschalkia acidurici]AFS77272.1 ribose 5-phosphate isomerase B [Gottschalkia acidurici 9a]
MKIGLGSDHGGYQLKEKIKKHLEEKGIECIDYGTNSEDSVDYPEFGRKVGEAVVSGECDKGIVCCGTGIGISIAANKVKGVRCALCGDTFSAKMTREHNDSNVLALGQRVTGEGLALEIVDTWIKTDFEGGRHQTRIEKISDIEKDYMK